MNHKTNSRKLQLIIILLFVAFAAWWVYINAAVRSADPNNNINNQAFSATYGVISLIGGITGLVASKKWGGWKSLIGRSLLFFSLGLLAQEFGQIAYSYYSYVLHQQIPYPSVGDIGYFGSVFLYIYAALQLAKASGLQFALKQHSKKLIAVILPLALLVASYISFLKGYQFDFSSLSADVRVVLDFGYPLGQAIYIAVALVTYSLSKGLLGGVMKKKVLLLLLALLIQYISDFSYLEAAKYQTAFPGGANDFMYLLAYAAMALALNSFRMSLSTGTEGQA